MYGMPIDTYRTKNTIRKRIRDTKYSIRENETRLGYKLDNISVIKASKNMTPFFCFICEKLTPYYYVVKQRTNHYCFTNTVWVCNSDCKTLSMFELGLV